MIRRPVVSVRDFDYRSDFGAAQPEEDASGTGEDRLTLSAETLAALFVQARSDGQAAAQAQAQGEALADATRRLNAALSDLLDLAKLLEDEAGRQTVSPQARRLINLAASRIIDGQRDLFSQDAD